MINGCRIIAKGIIDKTLKGKTIILNHISDEDIIIIGQMLKEEIKRQNKESNEIII